MIHGKGEGLGKVYGSSGELLLRSEDERFFGRRVLHVTVGSRRGLFGARGGNAFRALVYLTSLRIVAIGSLSDEETERHVPPPKLLRGRGQAEGPPRDYLELPRGEVVKLTRKGRELVISTRSEAGRDRVTVRPSSAAAPLFSPVRT